MIGNSSANALYGLSGDDFIGGMDGTDMLDGGYGNDYLTGGAGGDIINGGEGVDWAGWVNSSAGVLVSLIDDIAGGGDAQGDDLSGIENLEGSAFPDTLIGDHGANMLHGFDGDDTLKGFGGDDLIDGGNGHDVLNGGRGLDTMQGALGPDTFVWSSIDDTGKMESTADRVMDFRFSEGDRLDLGNVDANVYAAGDQTFTFIGTASFSGTPGEINYYHSGGCTYIQMQTGMSPDVEGLIRLDGILTPQPNWFVL